MLVIRSQKPSKIVEFVETNEPASVNGTPGDTWKKFLYNNGGDGDTFYDLEMGYLRAQGATSWERFVASVSAAFTILRERIAQFLKSVLGPANSYYTLEDGSGKYALEDGSGFYILE